MLVLKHIFQCFGSLQQEIEWAQLLLRVFLEKALVFLSSNLYLQNIVEASSVIVYVKYDQDLSPIYHFPFSPLNAGNV